MDPVSCVALATGAFKALKGAVSAGRDFQDMTSQLSTWGKAFSDFNELEKREKTRHFGKRRFEVLMKKQQLRFLPIRKRWSK